MNPYTKERMKMSQTDEPDYLQPNFVGSTVVIIVLSLRV
jgi:hypothetical protein